MEDEEYEDEGYDDEGSELDQLIEQQELELQQAEMERQRQVEVKLLRNKLRKIQRDIGISRTYLKENEKKTVKQAKKHKELKKDIKMINTMLSANKMKNTSKMMSASPMLMYVLIGAFILFLIICVVAIIGSLFPWLFPDDESGGGGASAAFGVTGKDFWGVRMVYTDGNKANASMVENYVEFVENTIEDVENISSISSGGESYTLVLNVNITLPSDDYDFSTFDEAIFASEYVELYSIVSEMAKIVYFADVGTAYAETNLVDCLSGIKYFGFANMEEIAPMVADEIIKFVEIASVKNSSGVEVTDTSTLNQVETDFNSLAKTNIISKDYSKLTIRTEKLFVKDFILEGDDAMVSGVQKENYVAMIFMPKNNVTFTKLSFSVGNADLTNFKISVSANGSEVALVKDDANYSVEGSETDNFVYISSDSLNVSASAFTDIDTSKLDALSAGLSLFDIVKDESVDYLKYLEAKTDEDSVNYFALKQNGVVVKTNNTEAFVLTEFETMWK